MSGLDGVSETPGSRAVLAAIEAGRRCIRTCYITPASPRHSPDCHFAGPSTAWQPPEPKTDLMAEIQKGYTAPPDKRCRAPLGLVALLLGASAALWLTSLVVAIGEAAAGWNGDAVIPLWAASFAPFILAAWCANSGYLRRAD